MPIFWAFGGEMFDGNGQPTVNSPEGIAALKFMIDVGQVFAARLPQFQCR